MKIIEPISSAIKLKPKHAEELESEVVVKSGFVLINSTHPEPTN